MKLLFSYVKQYFQSLNKLVFALTSLLVAILIFVNYSIGIEPRIARIDHYPLRILGFLLLYLFIFATAYWIHFSRAKFFLPPSASFYWLAFFCCLLFAWKIGTWHSASLLVKGMQEPWRKYWDLIFDWPLKAMVFLLFAVGIWRWARLEKPVAGMRLKNVSFIPYFIILLCLVPLIAFASTQSDFLRVYPKLKKIFFLYPYINSKWIWAMLYELSYGSDFFSIELFFRGVLVLGFARYVGKDAILPMAAFYCSIHFGKPMLECISSYFGGILLGVIVYRTQSIWGGLIAHLGIAWMMEIGGAIGHSLFDKI